VLQHADKIGDVGKACRYFSVGQASFYRWRAAFRQYALTGLVNGKTEPKYPANRTSRRSSRKVLYLRKTYRLGPIRIVWYLARYRAITILTLHRRHTPSCKSARVGEFYNLSRPFI
jgi:hypothetical protein